MRKTKILLVILAMIIIMHIVPTVSGSVDSVVHGSLSVDQALIVSDQSGNVIGIYPNDMYIEFLHTYAYGSTEENTTFKYNITEEKWSWEYPRDPPSTAYIPDIDANLSLSYDVELHVTSGTNTTTENNQTISSAGIVVALDVKIHIEFIKAPSKTGSIDIGDYLYKYAFRGKNPIVHYLVKAIKTDDNTEITIEKNIELDCRDISLNVFSVVFSIDDIYRVTYREVGDLDHTAVLKPVYDIRVCGNIVGDKNAELDVLVSYGESSVVLEIDGDVAPECALLKGVELIPGNNTEIVITVKSGVFTLPLNISKKVEGAIITIVNPTGHAVGEGASWEAVITAPVMAEGYFDNWPTIHVYGEIENKYFGLIQCSVDINKSGSYTLLCIKNITRSLTVEEILNSNFTAKITVIDDLGVPHVLKGTVSMNAFDPSDIANISLQIYNIALTMLYAGLVGSILLLLLSFISEQLGRIPIIDTGIVQGIILTIVASIIILQVGLPVAYNVYLDILSNIPIFRNYVDKPASSDPKTVFTSLIGYYEKLFEEIEKDYQVMYVNNINNLLSKVAIIAMIGGALMFVALALSTIITPGAGIPFSSLASGLFSIIFTYFGLLLISAPIGSIVLAGVVLGRMVIVMAIAVISLMTILGIALICIPSPLTQRFGEEMFGAAILYFITFPLLGPLTYSIYKYVIESSTRSIIDTIDIALGPANFVLPIRPVAEIMIYFVASGAVVLIIITSLAYILSRTGVATGIGEVLSSFVWRG